MMLSEYLTCVLDSSIFLQLPLIECVSVNSGLHRGDVPPNIILEVST